MLHSRLSRAALLCGAALSFSTAAQAQTAPADADDAPPGDILVVAQKTAQTIENAPSTRAAISAEQIATTVNAVTVEDSIKYLPSLVVRKRNIGDNFAPVATRTSGLGSSARSLIYADGALLSAFVNNNNGNGSPRWFMVTPEEVAQVDVLYGPFSAAYSGNSIGSVINITTRLPDKLEARLSVLTHLQEHTQYLTHVTAPSGQFAASIGDRFGRLALFASANRTVSNSQPISYVTAASLPAGTTGGVPTLNRTRQPIVVLGAGGIEHHVQDSFKLKAAYDITDSVRAIYVVGLFRDDTRGGIDSYLRSGTTGAVAYTSGFSSGIYRRDIQHWSHALSLQGSGAAFDWQVIGSLYDYARDIQRSPTGSPPAAFTGGAGTVQRQDGTGWYTLDAKAAWRTDGNILSFGAHYDRYKLATNSYTTTDWTGEAQGNVIAVSQGKTRTSAVWAQDAYSIAPSVTLTLGARYEWWRAYQGYNFAIVGGAASSVAPPERTAEGFSPKASVEWRPMDKWSVRLSAGQAFRFPTVGELYQTATVGTILTNPNPNLRPERARSAELAIERKDERGSVRLSLFSEVVKDALIAQTGFFTLPGETVLRSSSFVQNVDRTRARGVEVAVEQRDVLPRIDVQGSMTFSDAKTLVDAAYPAAVGKRLPSVPKWKATAVVTWRPLDFAAFTAAARYASRNFAALDNSDTFADTYQGFGSYFVMDLRARFAVTEKVDVSLGIDNVNNARYFLFHPFPQRSFSAQFGWKL